MSELNGKYVNEETYKKGKKNLKAIGIILTIVGAILLVVGIILIIKGFNTSSISLGGTDFDQMTNQVNQMFNEGQSQVGYMAGGGFCAVIGLAMCVVGIRLILVAHAREIAAFGASTIAPVAGETAGYMVNAVTPSISKAAETMSESIAKGVSKGKNEKVKATENLAKEKQLKCPKCGELNDVDAKFCNNCGVKFKQVMFCNKCGKKLLNDDKFCPSCGEKVE